MSVEGGPSGAISVGSVPAVSVGSSLGSFGPRMESVNSLPGIVNEGPVRGGLENMVTIDTFKPVGEIVFNPSVRPVIEQAESIAAAAWERSEPLLAQDTKVYTAEQVNIGYNQSRPRPIVPILPKHDLMQVQRTIVALEKAGLTDLSKNITKPLQQQAEAGPDSIGAGVVSKQTLNLPGPYPQEQAEQIAEIDEVVGQKVGDEDLDILEEERVELVKTSHSVDKKAVGKRYGAIIRAAKEAKAAKESKGESGPISGREIGEYVSNPQDLSFRGGEFNKVDPEGNLPDGTWEANLVDLDKTTFSSVEEVEKQAPGIISQNNPFEKGDGEGVTDKTIATGYKYAPTKAHKARQIALIRTKKRQILAGKEGQKVVRIIPAEEVKSNIEGRVEDYHPELAEALLAKAA